MSLEPCPGGWLLDPESREPLPAFDTDRKFMEEVAAARVRARHWRPGWVRWTARDKGGTAQAMYFAQCRDECCVGGSQA